MLHQEVDKVFLPETLWHVYSGHFRGRDNQYLSNAAFTWNQADGRQQTGCHLSG